MHLDLLRQLCRVPVVMYNILCAATFCIASSVMYGSRTYQVWSLPFYQLGLFLVFTIISLADAAPLGIRRSLTRTWSCVIFVVTFAIFLTEKMRTADTYSKYRIPEIGVEGMATVSFFNIRMKSLLVLSSLAALMASRGWQHSKNTVMLHTSPLLSELHSRAPAQV